MGKYSDTGNFLNKNPFRILTDCQFVNENSQTDSSMKKSPWKELRKRKTWYKNVIRYSMKC